MRRNDTAAYLCPVGIKNKHQKYCRYSRLADNHRRNQPSEVKLQHVGKDVTQWDAHQGYSNAAMDPCGNVGAGLNRKDGPSKVTNAIGAIAGANQYHDIAQCCRNVFVVGEECDKTGRVHHEYRGQCC